MALSLRLRIFAALFGASLVVALAPASAQEPELPVRAVLPMLASDGIDWGGELPQPDPSYCGVEPNPQRPPEAAIFGTLTVGGAPAPAGTTVQILFDGKAGPAVRTTDAGGYKILFDVGGASCSNHVGAMISFRVNGVLVETVRSVVADSVRHDIALP